MIKQPTLRDYRFRQRKSQYALQAISGVYQSRISLIENNLIQPSDREKMAIAKALGVSVNDISWPKIEERESRAPLETQTG